MTKGAIEMRKLAQSDKENKRNIAMKEKELADKEKQRAHERSEGRKDRWARIGSSAIGLFKLPKINDPEFYKQFIKDLSRYTNLSTYQRLGAESFNKYGIIARSDVSSNLHEYANPGVMVIDYIPTTGPQVEAISVAQKYPINQALNRTKEQILKSNSRSSVPWEGADIGLNIFCTADIYTALIEVKKALLIYQTYRGDNAYLAKVYLRALGWDYSDIDANIATYRKRLLVIGEKFNSSIVAPADISLYHRRAFLAGNVFADRDGTVKQVYMFKQRHYHELNPTGDGTVVLNRDTDNAVQQMSVFFGWIDNMIESITANPDFVEMYADLRSSVTNLLTFDGSIKPEDEISFNYDALNRAQIHNIKMLPWKKSGYATNGLYSTGDWGLHINSDGYLYQGNANGTTRRNFYWPTTSDTTDDINAFKQFLHAVYNHNHTFMPTLLDMDKDEITGDDILEITRGIFDGYCATYSTGTALDIYSCGTELFYYANIWSFNLYTGNMASQPFGTYEVYLGNTSMLTNTHILVALYTKFDWAPMMTYVSLNNNIYTPVQDDNIICQSCMITDLDHAFTIGGDDSSQLNEACTLSEFYMNTSQFKQ